MQPQVIKNLPGWDVGLAGAEDGPVQFRADIDFAADLLGGFGELGDDQRVGLARGHEPRIDARVLQKFAYPQEQPEPIGAHRAVGEQPAPGTVCQQIIHLRGHHLVGFHVVGADLPGALVAGVGEHEVAHPPAFRRRGRRSRVPVQNAVGPFGAGRGRVFVQKPQRRAAGQAHQKIRERQPPQADPRRTDGRQFVVTRVLGQRIQQRQQQCHRQHNGQKFRGHHEVILRHIPHAQAALLEIIHLPQQVG
ncbi:MAG: hypothetical protein BWX84_01263 [Verrucomicrobia bacterium ADurb.Bin118]|nr:MAG: hypothetical protein BWX84_01263 [Verrucomicrobia bacterium ADurb.Bin118]